MGADRRFSFVDRERDDDGRNGSFDVLPGDHRARRAAQLLDLGLVPARSDPTRILSTIEEIVSSFEILSQDREL